MFLVTAFGLAMAAAPQASDACEVQARAEIDRLEDQAFAAMKSAHEAVESAARRGAVGSAGDVEWSRYKALRAQAEQWRAKVATGACGEAAASPGAAVALAPAPAAIPAPASTARPEPLATAEPRRFRLSFTSQIGELDLDQRDRVKTELQSVILRDDVNRIVIGPGGPTLLDIPTALALPLGGIVNVQQTARNTGAPVRQSIDAWSSRQALGVEYRPAGFDAAGWRLNGSISAETFTMKGSLAAPFSGGGYQVSGPSTFGFCGNSACNVFARFTPATTNVAMIDSVSVSRIDLDSTRQVDTLFETAGGVSRALDVGPVRLVPGAAVSSGWWWLDEDEVIAGRRSNGAAYLARMQRKADGPTFKATASLGVEGDQIFSLPLRWSLSGDYGVRWVSLDLHSRLATGRMDTENLTRSRGVAGATASIEYRFNPAWGLALTADHREHIWLDTPVGDNPASGVALGDGSSAKLRKHGLSSLGARLQYDF
ncbi:hypothetical protein AS593_07875 [Caulobacter vibrioides]|nr:hypothetical protein AS593_07875 [Caulobacter vibrioides]